MPICVCSEPNNGCPCNGENTTGWKRRFQRDGKDIVYLPMLYQNGNLTPAGSAFLLDKHGKQQILEPHKETAPITVSTYTAYLFTDEVIETKRTLNGACLLGSPDKNFAHADTLVCLNDLMESWGNRHTDNQPYPIPVYPSGSTQRLA